MSNVRAKFRVMSVTRMMGSAQNPVTGKYEPAETQTIKLNPVVGDTPENKKFFAATPGGEIALHVVRQEVGDKFVLGKEYYIDFVPTATPVE